MCPVKRPGRLGSAVSHPATWLSAGQKGILPGSILCLEIRKVSPFGDAGTFIGYSVQGSQGHPIVSLAGNASLDLNNLLIGCPGCIIGNVWDINNHGQILAWGTVNGQVTQMILTPEVSTPQ
jgi:hypothetical protein